MTNAQQAFDRAQELLKTAAGTQKTLRRRRGGAAPGQGQSGLVADAARRAATRYSPVDGTVQQVYYRPGEMVPAGRPVVALLPPRQSQGALLRAGGAAARDQISATPSTVSCDGCATGLTAKVSFIARSAEFTPPVIYSLEERAKLVFLIEARPEQPEKFRVGQPVSVTLPQEAPK